MDEINLASAETLQCLSSLLESDGTVTIYEKTDSTPISRHPNFRLMAAMNPATDVGKKDLPPGIRNRYCVLNCQVVFILLTYFICGFQIYRIFC